MTGLSLLQISSGGLGGEAPPSPEPVGARARGETKGLRRKALNLETVPTREARDDLA